MLKYLLITLICLILLPVSALAIFTFPRDNFDSHKWTPETGTEFPTLDYDSTRFASITALRVAIGGTGDHGYAFLHTDQFSFEDWSKVTAVQADVYYEDSTTGNSPTCKFEAKIPNGSSVEAIYTDLPKNSWQTVTWPLTTTFNYSTVVQVWMTVEVYTGYTPRTTYFDNIKLVKDDGATQTWDAFDGNVNTFTYGGVTSGTKFANTPFEIRSHNQAYPSGSGCAVYLAWDWNTTIDPSTTQTYAQIAQSGLSENWTTLDVQTVQYQLWTTNTASRYKIFLFDGSVGFAPPSQTVSSVSSWVTLNFDVSSSAIANSLTPTFNRSNITEFKYVVEYLDVAGAATGECYFDNANTLDSVPVELSSFEIELKE